MKISNVTKTLGNFSLEVPALTLEEGLVHGFIGPNGSGKSTLAKLIMGIYQPDDGEMDYQGINQMDITMTAQRPYLIQGSVYDNIVLPLKLRKKPVEESVLKEYLQRFALENLLHQPASSLSSGERQKVSFIRALIFNPRLIIVDESLSNMDVDAVHQAEDLIRKKQGQDPATWILISHQLGHIYRMCQQVYFFHKGHILEQGPGRDILQHPATKEMQEYMQNQRIEVNHHEAAYS